MDKLEVFNTIAGENQKLKLMNRVLIGNVRSLKKELAEIRRQEGLNI
jgi:hypothetical protein